MQNMSSSVNITYIPIAFLSVPEVSSFGGGPGKVLPFQGQRKGRMAREYFSRGFLRPPALREETHYSDGILSGDLEYRQAFYRVIVYGGVLAEMTRPK